MRVYKIKVCNDRSWISVGGISREFYVFSGDMTGALMEAETQLTELRTELCSERCPDDAVNALRVTHIDEMGDVCGKTSMLALLDEEGANADDWAKRTALRIRKDRC